ncbi:MAG TPA: hypothetical protein VGO22_14740 [Pseudorhizobium sp.]|jgi:hypothetical protein|nr:hypothetical protein [Pseudorhizobium sp.]
MTRTGNSFPGNETFENEPAGRDWLSEFRSQFPEEFPEPKKPEAERAAQRDVETGGTRPAREGRF